MLQETKWRSTNIRPMARRRFSAARVRIINLSIKPPMALHDTHFKDFQRMARALHVSGPLLGIITVPAAGLGAKFGSSPRYGEVAEQYIMSKAGYNAADNFYPQFDTE